MIINRDVLVIYRRHYELTDSLRVEAVWIRAEVSVSRVDLRMPRSKSHAVRGSGREFTE
jgi:hypothetical protein